MARDNTIYNAQKRMIANENANNGYPLTTTYGTNTNSNKNDISFASNIVKAKLAGGGGGTGKTGSSTTNSGYGVGDYLSSLYEQRQAAAQDAYDKARSLLDDAYNTASGNYANIYNRGVGQLGNSYQNSLNKINNNAMDAFRQAYINKELSEKNLGQRLAAMGISGGESESALTKLLTQYGNSRSNIQRTLDTNRSDLETDYNSNLANLYNAYQSSMANLDQQRASQLAALLQNLNNQVTTIQGDYFSKLASNPQLIQQALNTAMGNMNAYTPTEAVATNDFNPVTVMQKNDVGDTATNYSKWLDYINNQRANGVTDNTIIQALTRQGLDANDIYKYLYA